MSCASWPKWHGSFKVILLSDEIYGELHHQGNHLSIAQFYPEGTIISSGLSKWCGAGGWRLGTFTFPGGLRWLLDAMAAVASETFTSTSAPIQYAAVCAFKGGSEISRYLFHCRRILRALGGVCAANLRSAGIDVHLAGRRFLPVSRLLSAQGERYANEASEHPHSSAIPSWRRPA